MLRRSLGKLDFRHGWVVRIGGALIGLACSAAAVLAADPGPVAPPTEEQQKQIDALIAQLGSSEFQQREAATTALKKFGEVALTTLEKAMKSDDAEVRQRAQTARDFIRPPRESLCLKSINENKVELNGFYSTIEISDVNGQGQVDGVNVDAEEIVIGSINGNGVVKLKGVAKKLRITSINGLAQLDASELVAEQVEINDINGIAKVKLRAKGGVSITGSITGAVEVAMNCDGNIRFAKSLTGGSKLSLKTSGNLLFDEDVVGGVQLNVELCKDLTVKGRLIAGAQLEANYFGEATCEADQSAKATLNRVAVPAADPKPAKATAPSTP